MVLVYLGDMSSAVKQIFVAVMAGIVFSTFPALSDGAELAATTERVGR